MARQLQSRISVNYGKFDEDSSAHDMMYGISQSMKAGAPLSSITFCLVLLLCPIGYSFQDRNSEAQQREEAEDYYKKWLEEDVVYIITDEEKAVFEQLTTPEEKEQFIEQFWFRRDEDPRTIINEFKEEHYRRIAYANERFSSGLPGWMTDRGQIYIIHGEPDEMEVHPSGGFYERPPEQGGGKSNAFPFEVWRYRNIDGIGNEVILEFVDPTLTGQYRLALEPEEKDALLYMPGGGPTLAEELGLATKAERPFFTGGRREDYPLMYSRAADNPFTRYETYSAVQTPKPLKYRDLKQLVEVDLQFPSIPFETRKDYFKLNEERMLVPISIQVENRHLTFKQQQNNQVARLAVYGLVTSISNRLVEEFDDDVLASYSAEMLERGLQNKSIYQKVLILDRKMRYKLNLVIKDLSSQKVGVLQTAIIPPQYEDDVLSASSLILSRTLQVIDGEPDSEELFVIGDVKVRPNLDKSFSPDDALGIYFQLYNVDFDQSSLEPSLWVTYRITGGGKAAAEVIDETGESIHYFSNRRAVLLRNLSLQGLAPGEYGIQVEIEDQLTGQKLRLDDSFRVVKRVG